MKILRTAEDVKPHNPSKTYTRNIPSHGDFRHISVKLMPVDPSLPDEVTRGDTHEVLSVHECWTGYQWLGMVNRQGCRSFGEAVTMAKECVLNLS